MSVKRSILFVLCTLFLAQTFNLLSSNQIASSCTTSCRFPKTTFIPRSQGVNAARELVGWQQFINRFDVCGFYGSFATALEYTQSMQQNHITSYFFGPAAQNCTVNFSGSQVANRGQFDLLADYFGMPTDFKSTVSFKPKIQNVIADFEFYFGLDNFAPNMYVRVHAPLTYTKWHFKACENVTTQGSNAYELGYMTKDTVARSSLGNGVLPFFAGCTTFGDMKTPLRFGKISPKALTKTLLADLQCVLGWNFINADYYHLGLNLQTSFPTGNKPTGEFLFEPLVGNGGHFELGAGVTSHAILWESDCSESYLAAYLDANITYLFSTRQVRSFDFTTNGPLSRYMLAAQYQAIPRNADNEPLAGHLSGQVSTEYAGALLPAVNLTTLCSDAGIHCNNGSLFQGDMALKLTYKKCAWSFDLGYNLWGRTKEQVSITDRIATNLYALKGDSYMYGTATPGAGYPANAIPLSASQSETATIFTGSNWKTGQTPPPPIANPGVDSRELAITGVATPVLSPNAPNPQMFTSNPTHFVDATNVDLESATSPSQLTHKVFGNITYAWEQGICNYENIIPFLGLGFEAEFDNGKKISDCTNCDCRAGLSQWGVMLKGGIGF